MTAYAQHDSTLLSPRTIALIVIAGLHVAVFYAFTAGLAHRIVEVIPHSIQAAFLKDTPHDVPPPPPLSTDVHLTRPKLVLSEPPPFKTDLRPDLDEVFKTVIVGRELPAPPPLKPETPIKRVLGGPSKGFPNSSDYYPAASRRLGEQGSTTIQVCTDRQGKLTADPTVLQSSGITRIDDGALKLAKAGSGHYRATTENGAAVNGCYPFRITFDFGDRSR